MNKLQGNNILITLNNRNYDRKTNFDNFRSIINAS